MVIEKCGNSQPSLELKGTTHSNLHGQGRFYAGTSDITSSVSLIEFKLYAQCVCVKI